MADKMFSDITLNDLTEMQRAFIEDTTTAGSFKNIFLTGCAGSGKTLVAAMTAKEFLRQKKDVQFLTYTKFLRKYVEDHFERQDADISADNFHHWAYQTDREDEDGPITNLAIWFGFKFKILSICKQYSFIQTSKLIARDSEGVSGVIIK